MVKKMVVDVYIGHEAVSCLLGYRKTSNVSRALFAFEETPSATIMRKGERFARGNETCCGIRGHCDPLPGPPGSICCRAVRSDE